MSKHAPPPTVDSSSIALKAGRVSPEYRVGTITCAMANILACEATNLEYRHADTDLVHDGMVPPNGCCDRLITKWEQAKTAMAIGESGLDEVRRILTLAGFTDLAEVRMLGRQNAEREAASRTVNHASEEEEDGPKGKVHAAGSG